MSQSDQDDTYSLEDFKQGDHLIIEWEPVLAVGGVAIEHVVYDRNGYVVDDNDEIFELLEAERARHVRKMTDTEYAAFRMGLLPTIIVY